MGAPHDEFGACDDEGRRWAPPADLLTAPGLLGHSAHPATQIHLQVSVDLLEGSFDQARPRD